MVRVLKPGGEARFHFYGRKCGLADNSPDIYIDSVEGALKELEENGYNIEFINIRRVSEINGEQFFYTVPIVKITKPKPIKYK